MLAGIRQDGIVSICHGFQSLKFSIRNISDYCKAELSERTRGSNFPFLFVREAIRRIAAGLDYDEKSGVGD